MWRMLMGTSMQELGIDRLSREQREELARRDADLDANPERALSWEQIRASIEGRR
ncbi:MAG: addiction module protein [Fimbriiglobus sp.]